MEKAVFDFVEFDTFYLSEVEKKFPPRMMFLLEKED